VRRDSIGGRHADKTPHSPVMLEVGDGFAMEIPEQVIRIRVENELRLPVSACVPRLGRTLCSQRFAKRNEVIIDRLE
jgi:hypothetical protein